MTIFCWLIVLTGHFDEDPDVVSRGFEMDFLSDISKRFKEEGPCMYISGRMLNVLRRIGVNRYGLIWTFGDDE